MSDTTSTPSPLLFFDAVNSYQRTHAIKAAIELDLFTSIAEGHETVSHLARRLQSTERGIRILCDYLTVCGFLTKTEDRYQLTHDSTVFLNQSSPAYIGGAIEFLLSPMLMDKFKDLGAKVRKGAEAFSDQGTVSPDHPIWVHFARAMAPMMAMPAELMATLINTGPNRSLKVLDIAAGHGLFGITLAKLNPLAEITAVDWPNVLDVAQEHARKAGVNDRYQTIPGDAFEVNYGSGYDVVLLTNFLHHFDEATCEKLLRKVYDALADGGRVVTLEFVPNEDRVSPPIAAVFSLVMLASTPSGDAYTYSELARMFSKVGFAESTMHELPPSPNRAVISTK